MAHQSLPLLLKQEYPGTNIGNMSYTQLLQMHTPGKATMAGYYNQDPAIHEFGVPSANSLDSGYEETDPFERSCRYHTANDVDFDQTCTMNQQNVASIDYGAFGYPPPILQRDASNFGGFPNAELHTSFQPLLDPTDTYGQYQASPGLEDASEDGRTASMCSNSPQQITFGMDASPRQQQQQQQQQASFWSEGSGTMKRRSTDSSVEIKCESKEAAVPKSTSSRGRPRKRIPHTAVERRYRENLNAHLEQLRAAVPNLTAAQRRKSTDGADPMKPSKCEVLMGAVNYIKRLEVENERLKRRSGHAATEAI